MNKPANKPATAGYKPLPHIWFTQPRDLPVFSFQQIRAMLMDPGIQLNLATRAAPLHSAQFAFKAEGDQWIDGLQCEDPVIGEFIYKQLIHIWRNYLPELLRAQVWGWSAGEITMCEKRGLVVIDRFLPRHAADCELLLVDHNPYGVLIQRVEEKGAVGLKFPYCWIHQHNAEDGEIYGKSILLGAFSPWADKWYNGGALDVRRLFMHKDAYGGVDLGYPEGTTWVAGQEEPVPNADIARQLTEQLQAGGVTTRPSDRDANGNEKWPLTRATVPSNPSHILEYPQHLDDEIRRGMGIPDDVVSADGGAAWAGKRVTIASFYASLDHWVSQIVTDLKEQVFDPLCELNFGKIPEYEIRHKPLAEQAMEQQANAGPGQEPGGMDMGMGGMEPPMDPGMMPGDDMAPPADDTPFVMALDKYTRMSVADQDDDTPPGPQDFAMTDERIEVMADLLAAIYGDQAEEFLDGLLGEPQKMATWNPDDHPRGPDGRFIKKGTEEAYALAREKVSTAHRERSEDSMKELMDHMNTLTVKQLHRLKRDYGTKASAKTKAALIEKLSGRLISGRHRLARRDNDTPVAPVNEEVYSVPTQSLNIDPARFQYKVKGIGDKGVGEELKGTAKWNPELGGVLLVWRDPQSGKDFVVNGHHRHELASRTGTDQINVRYIEAPDAKQARAKGALANIAEGRGTALDAAKYLRDSDRDIDHLRDAGISMSGKVAADAAHLVKLSGRAFQAVTNGMIDEDKAIAVAKWLPDHALQDKLFKRIQDREDDGKEWTLRETEQAAKKMEKAGRITKSGTDLFGDFEEEESTFDQEVEIEAYISRQLAQEASDYSAVSNVRRAERVADAGNTLATDENQKRRDQARVNLDTFDRESGLKGEISAAIREFAAELAAATNRKQRTDIKQQAYEAIKDLLDEPTIYTEDDRPTTDAAESWTRESDPIGALAMSILKQWDTKPGKFALSDQEAAEVEAGMRKLLHATDGRPTEDDSEPDAYDDMQWDPGEPDDQPDAKQLLMSLIRMATAHAPKGGVTIDGTQYTGGEFIPGHSQAEVDAAAATGGKTDATATTTKATAKGSKAGARQPGVPPKPAKAPSASKDGAAKPKRDIPGTRVDSEPTTAPPPGKHHAVNVDEVGEHGVSKSARVGVGGKEVPPPPPVPQLPNLTKAEREVETRFRSAFLKDPNGLANDYRKLVYNSSKPYTFETDQGKMLSDDWVDEDLDKQMQKRQHNNNALHQTANAIVKRAFLMHLDTLQPGDNVLVTVGGCGAGKGYTLKSTELGKGLSAKAKAVWDSAGDQNATENPWIQEEAEKRGLNVTYAFVSRDPKVAWAHPKLGVVHRAHNKEDGRMVDAAVFADSYVLGAKNHHAFHQANKDNPNATFLFFDGNTQQQIEGVPEESRNMDRKALYHWAMGSIQGRSDVAPSVLRGATQGARIWNQEFAA